MSEFERPVAKKRGFEAAAQRQSRSAFGTHRTLWRLALTGLRRSTAVIATLALVAALLAAPAAAAGQAHGGMANNPGHLVDASQPAASAEARLAGNNTMIGVANFGILATHDVSLSVSPSLLAETAGETTVTVTATLVTTRSEGTVVSLTLSGTAEGGGTDYSIAATPPPPSSITIPAGDLSADESFGVDPVDDSIDEGTGETITVSGTATGLSVDPADITITDNDTASTTVTLSASDTSIDEDDSAATVTVTATLQGSVSRDVATVVSLDAALGGTAQGGGTDYTGSTLPSSVTIAAGSLSGTSASFTITPVDDSIDEGTGETITLGGTLSGFTVNSADISLADNDTASTTVTLSASDTSIDEDDSATTVTVTATLQGSVSRSVATVVSLGLSGTAQGGGTDYTDTLPSSVTIAAGSLSGTSASFTITPVDDSIDEGTGETITLGGTLSGFTVNSADISLADNDTASTTVTLSASDTSIDEDDSATTVTVTATLQGSVSRDVATVVSLDAALGGTAQGGGTDYTGSTLPSSVTIAAGSLSGTSASFTITPVDDSIDEGTGETITLGGTLSGFTVNSADISLADNDTASTTVTLSASDTSIDEDDSAATVTVTATLQGSVSRDVATVVSLDAALGGTAQGGGTDYTGSTLPSSVTIAAGSLSGTSASFTITPVDDSIDEGTGETITLGGTLSGFTVNSADISLADNDTASTTVTLSASDTSIDEDDSATTVTVTATLQGSVSRSVATVVSLGLSGTAQGGGTDYTDTLPSSVTIAAGSLSGTSASFTITPVDDSIDEGTGETITLGGTLSGFTVNSADISLADNDTASTTVTLSASDTSIDEDDSATTVTVTATLQGSVSRSVATVVSLGLSGTAQGGGTDYTDTLPSSVTIAAGSLSGTSASFTITPVDDSIDEGTGETITLGGTLSGFTVNSADISLADNDTASTTVTLSASDTSIDEDDSAATVTVTATLQGSVSRDVATVVSLDAALGGTAQGGGTDYTGSTLPSSVTIAAGSLSGTSASFTITPVDDSIDEGTGETITLGGTLSGFTVNSADISLADNDTASTTVTLSASDTSIDEDDSAATVTVTATLQGSVSRDVATVVSLDAALGGTAQGGGTDYTGSTLPSSVTIAAGSLSGTSASFTITPVDDSIDEGTGETITLGGTLSGFTVNPLTITIADNDTLVKTITLSVSDRAIGEGETDASSVTVTAKLDSDASSVTDTVVTLSLDGTATRGASDDYTVMPYPPDTITIPAGSFSATGDITITPVQDTDTEGVETITVNGEVASDSEFTVNAAEIALADDEAPSRSLRLSVSMPDVSIAENGSVTVVLVTATLDGGLLPSDVTVRLALSSTDTQNQRGADAGVDYLASPLKPVITIPAGELWSAESMLTFVPLADTLDEGPETITVGGTARSSSASLSVGSADITLTDDPNDVASTTVTLSASDTSIGEGETGATTVTVTATLQGSVSRSVDTVVSLDPELGGTAQGGGTDYSSTTRPLSVTILAGSLSGTSSAFRITPRNDNDTEEVETITLGGTLSDFTVNPLTITLADDDTPSTSLTLSVSPVSLAERADATTVTVTASLDGGTRSEDTTVTLSLSGTADSADYTAPSALGDTTVDITIPAGEISASAAFDIDPTQDSIDEGAGETITVDGTAASGDDTLTVSSTATLTIADDDTASTTITLSVSPSDISEDASDAVDVVVTAELAETALGTVTRSVPTDVTLRLAGTATTGDYTVAPDLPVTLTIPIGATSATRSLQFDPVDDIAEEGDETIDVIGTATGFTVYGVTVNLEDDDVTVPDPVTGVEAVTRSSNAVRLSWDAPGESEALSERHFWIQHGLAGSLWEDTTDDRLGAVDICNAAQGKCTYTVSGLDSGTNYQWRVIHVDNLGIRSKPSDTEIAATARFRIGGSLIDSDGAVQCSADLGQGTAIVVNGWSPADISLAAALAARVPDAVVLYAAAEALPGHVEDLLCSIRPRRVTLVGGAEALSRAVADEVGAAAEGADIERLSGETRVHTAAALARSVLSDPRLRFERTFVIANGWSAPDAGAAAAIAARASESAVLYTAPDALPQATLDVITDYLPAHIVIVGGTAAVTHEVEEALAAAAPNAVLRRAQGATRVETAAAAARRALGSTAAAVTHTVIVVNGWSPPDIGAATALAAAIENSAVVYTTPDALPQATLDVITDYRPARIIIVGGTAVVPEAVRDAIAVAVPGLGIERIAGRSRTHTAAAVALRALGRVAG